MKTHHNKDAKQSYGDKTKNLKEKAKIYFSGVNKVWKGIKKYQEKNKSKTDILFEHIRELAQQKREKDRVARENSSMLPLLFYRGKQVQTDDGKEKES